LDCGEDEVQQKSLMEGRCLDALVRGLMPPLCVLLSGDLGAGKTTLARRILRGLGWDGEVPSPTFTLVQPYVFKDFEVWHIDAWRLKSPAEALALDLETAFARHITLIEWPEKIAPLLPQEWLKISITAGEDGGRAYGFSAAGERAGMLVQEIEKK
jgi:tRNA threonylcarbamoyladenosine biosynthesis protein TsaE